MAMTNAINGLNSYGASYSLSQSAPRSAGYTQSSSAVSRGAVDNGHKFKKYSPEQMELADKLAMLNFNQGNEVSTTQAATQMKTEGADKGSIFNKLASLGTSLFGTSEEVSTTQAATQMKTGGTPSVDEIEKLAATNPFTSYVPDNQELHPEQRTEDQGKNLYLFC